MDSKMLNEFVSQDTKFVIWKINSFNMFAATQ